MPIQLLVLNFGYVESSSLASVSFLNTQASFKTPREALCDLSQSLFEMYVDRHQYGRNLQRDCCKESHEQDKEWGWCPKCGNQLRSDIDFEDYQGWLSRLYEQIADGFTMDDYSSDWWPWNSFKEIVEYADSSAEVTENADWFLVSALDPEWLEKFPMDGVPVRKYWEQFISRSDHYPDWKSIVT